MLYFPSVEKSSMRNDQIFVLMLVILLPMSGCFDGAIGDVDAQEMAEENERDLLMYDRIFVPSNGTQTITTNGTTITIEAIHVGGIDPECSRDCPVTWTTTPWAYYSMICDDGFEIETGMAQEGRPLPGGHVKCAFTLKPGYSGGYGDTVYMVTLDDLSDDFLDGLKD